VRLTPETSRVREGRKVTVTAVLARPFKNDVKVRLGYTGTATREKDYYLLDQFETLTIPAGKLSTTEKITVAALTDNLQEGEEVLDITIVSVSDPLVKIGNAAKVFIEDVYPPDPPPGTPVRTEPENPDIVTHPMVSPNDDGKGYDFFHIENIISFPDNEVVIFNRWGNEVFRIKNYNETDRVFKGFANTGLLTNTGAPLPDGVYYYLIYTYKQVNNTRDARLNKGYLILKR
jgi:gliding motility-associated-like protein